MASDRNNLYNELSEKDTATEQFNRTDKRFKLDVEYIQESSAENASNNLVIESSLNNIQLVVGPTKNIELYGNVLVKESINLQSVVLRDASINLNAKIGGSLTVNDDVSLNKSVNILENLEVVGDTSTNNLLVNGRADISENLYVNGDVSFQRNLDVSGELIATELTVLNNTRLNNNVDISENLYVKGDVSVSGELIATTIKVLGDVSFNRNVDISDRLVVYGDVSFNEDVDICGILHGNNLIINGDASFKKNVEIIGNLNSGSTNISDSLNVDGDVSLNSSVDINNKLNVHGDVYLHSKAYISNYVNLKSKLVVDGDVSLNANVDIAGAFKINDLVVAGDVSYNANVDISNRLVVNGDISLNKSVDISNDLNVNNKLIVRSDVSLNSSVDISNSLNVNNKLIVKNDVSLNKNVDILENLNVGGDLSINLNMKIGNKLIVGSDVSLNSSVDIANDLNVNGDVSLNNNVDISENLNIGGNTTIDGNTVIVGNLEANNVTFADFSATNIIVNENTIEIGKNISLTTPVNIAIGSYAGHSDRGNDTTAIGRLAGNNFQNTYGIAIGTKAGQGYQNINAIAIGTEAGLYEQGENSIAIGEKSGHDTQGENGISIGKNAGYTTQSENAIAIGNTAGNNSQSENAIAIGNMAGYTDQGTTSIAIGDTAGHTDQGTKSIAIGYASGNTNQGIGGIAIGNEAGYNNQGNYSIGIGYNAGRTIQAENSIILNALGTALNTNSSGLYVAPIRNGVKNNVLQYDTATKELVYANQIDITGTITSSDITCGTLTVSGLIDTQNNDLSMGTGTIVCKRVTVDEMTITGDISINNLDILQRFNVLGDTNLLSRLDVTNDVSLNSSLDVNNRLFVNGDVSLNGNVDITNDLVVRNDVNLLKKLVVGTDASFLGNLDVLGQFGVSDIKLTGDVSFQESVDIDKRLVVALDSLLNGNVTVASDVSIGGELDITGVTNLASLNATGDLSVNDNLLVGKELRVTRDASFISNVFISENLKVDGDVSFQRNVYIQDGNINVGSGKTLDVSLGTLILRDGQISGDKINGGTIDEITISKLTGAMDCNNELISNLNISGGVINFVTISNSNIELSSNNVIDIRAATLILSDNQINGDKINGGTIDDISISKLGGIMDCNDQSMSNVNINNGKITSITISNNTFLIDNSSIVCLSNTVVDFSAGTILLKDGQISGDKINGGTIDDISISKLGGSMDCNAELMTNVNISGGIVNNITISNSDIFMVGKTIDLSGATLILKDNQISGDKITGGIIDNITISEIHGPIDICNQLMSNVNISGGLINDVSGTLGSIKFTPGSLLDFSDANILFAPNQLTGDSIGGGTIPEITISKLLGAMDCNTQAMTNVNILSGNLTGVTINGTITISTLGGAMNANNQFISNVNIDSGDISNVNITANSYKGPGITDNIGSELFTSSKLATVGAIKSYIAYGNGGGTDGDISFGNMDLSGTLNTKAINLGGDIIPTQDAVFDIGSATKQIKDLYLSSSTLYMGTSTPGEVKPVLTVSGGRAEFIGAVVAPPDISTNTKLDELEVSGNVIFTNSESKFVVEGDVSLNKNLDVSGTVKAVSFVGDGSQLTGVADVVLDNYSDASLGFVDICKNLTVLGDLSGTTASFSRITLGSEAFIYGPETIYIDPVIAGSPDAAGLLVVRGSIQALGTITTVNTETIEVLNNVITLNANTPAIASAGITIKDQNDISRGLLWQNAPHDRWDISDNLHLGSHLEVEGDVSVNSSLDVTGIIKGRLGTALQPNITSLGVLTGLSMEGNLDLSGQNITNVGNLAGTLTNATQTNVTRVGTLTGLTLGGNVDLAGNNLINGGTMAGTLTTANQTNVTSLGVLTGLSMEGDLDLCGQNITNVGNLAGTLTTGAQPNITSLGQLSELKLSGGINLGNEDISDVRFIYTTTTNATNVIATNTVVGTYLSGVVTTAEQEYITKLGVMPELVADSIITKHITFSGENIFIDGADFSINQTLDCSALIVKELTVSGSMIRISANDISVVGVIDISGDIVATGFRGDGSKLIGVGSAALTRYHDGSFNYVDICKNLIVEEDVSVNRNLDVSGLLTVGGLNEASQVKALYYNTTTGEITYDNSGGSSNIIPGSDASFSSIDISSKLNVKGELLVVGGDVSFQRNLDVSDNLTVSGSIISRGNISSGYKTDLTSYFGRAAIGYTGHNLYAGFSHVNRNTGTEYALLQEHNGTTYLNAAAGRHLHFRINNQTKMKLTSDGELGIGITNPNSLLHVAGDASFNGDVDISDNLTVSGSIISNGRITVAGDTSLNGEVDITGSLKVAYATDLTSYFGRAAIGYTGHNLYAGFSHVNRNTGTEYALLQEHNGTTYLNAAAGRHLHFRINNQTKMKLTSDGELGIGITNPNSLLHVAGDASFNGGVDISENLYVNGDVSFQRNLDVSGQLIASAVRVLDDLSVNTFSAKYIKSTVYRIGIGEDAGRTSQGNYSLAIGSHAGESSQGEYSVAIGNYAGTTSQGFGNVAIGNVAGRTNQGNYGIAVGFYAGNSNQVTESIAIGSYAGQTSQATKSIAIGSLAGNNYQGEKSVSIGYYAGKDQSANSVAIGNQAGEKQGQGSIAIGNVAGKISQGGTAVAIGQYAGNENQSLNSVAIGHNAGKSEQDVNAVALGYEAALTDQSLNAVAIGYQAGYSNQGKDSIAIGSRAGLLNQHSNTIAINATGVTMNTSDTSGLYVDPIRESLQGKALYYNTSTKEITYDNSFVGIASDSDASLVSLDLSGTLKIQERPVKVVLDNYVTSRNLTVITGAQSSDSSYSILYSLDGIDYIGVKNSLDIFTVGHDILYDSSKNMWFGAGAGTYSLAYSYDGIEWYGIEDSKQDSRGSNFSVCGRTLAINPYTGLIVAGGEGVRTAAYSSDGLNWTYIQIYPGYQTMYDLIYHKITGRFYGTFLDNAPPYEHIKYSTDGLTWTGINVQTFYSSLLDVRCIATNGRRIVAGFLNTNIASGGNFQHMIYSDDNGSSWNDCSKNNNEYISKLFTLRALSIKYANGIWIAGGQQYSSNPHEGYSIARSSDGIIWTGISGTTDLMTSVNDVEWNGVRWVATGGLGSQSVLYSEDNGLTWTAVTDSSKNLIIHGNGIGVTSSKNTFATNETIKRLKLNNLSDVIVGSENFENSLKIGSNKTGTLSLAERNTIIGISGGNSITTGTDNTSVGYNTIYSLTTGKDNIALGSSALESLTSGNYNTALGNHTLKKLTTTSANTAVGDKVLYDCSGSRNTSVGTWSGGDTTIGGDNTFMGYAAAPSIRDGSYNIAIGSMAAYGVTGGTGNIYIGYQTGTITEDSSNAIAIGYKAYSSTNKITIGNTSHTHSKIYGNLTIPGDASFNGNVDISENLTVAGDASFNGGVDISENLYVNGDVSFQRNLDLSGRLRTDSISSYTHLNGISLESITIIGNNITDANVVSAQNFNIGGTNAISASRQGNFRDLEIKSGANQTTLLVDGDTGNVSMNGTLSVDTITSKTNLNGISLESITIIGNNITDANVVSAQNFNIGGTNAISASRQGNFRDLEIKSGANQTTLLVDGDTGNITTSGQINGPSTFIIDPAAVGDNTGIVVIRGGLQVDGSSTIINSSTLDISDHRILLASSATNQTQTYGAGIEVSGNKTFKYVNGDVWESNIDLSAAGITTTTLRATNIDLSLQNLLDISSSHYTMINANTTGLAATDLSIAHIVDTSAAHYTMINANTTLLSVTAGTAAASKALVLDSNKDMAGIRNISFTNNILPQNNTAQLPVSYSSCLLKTTGLDEDLSGTTTNWTDAQGYILSKTLLSPYSYVKIEIKASYISSPAANETLSFRVLRSIDGGSSYNATPVFTDSYLGSTLGVNIKNVYTGLFIDSPNTTNLTYKLQFKREGNNIITPYGMQNGGNYFFIQEIYRPIA